MEVVVTLPNVKQPYYGRMYVIRNNNGFELRQSVNVKEYYKVNGGSAFCAGT